MEVHKDKKKTSGCAWGCLVMIVGFIGFAVIGGMMEEKEKQQKAGKRIRKHQSWLNKHNAAKARAAQIDLKKIKIHFQREGRGDGKPIGTRMLRERVVKNTRIAIKYGVLPTSCIKPKSRVQKLLCMTSKLYKGEMSWSCNPQNKVCLIAAERWNRRKIRKVLRAYGSLVKELRAYGFTEFRFYTVRSKRRLMELGLNQKTMRFYAVRLP